MEIETIFMIAQERGASDIHITAGSPPMLRVNGKLSEIEVDSLDPEDTQLLAYNLLSDEQIKTFERDRELDFGVTYQGHRIRGNAYWYRECIGVALRIIPIDIPSPAELRLPEILLDWINKPQGLILITGATGQGKSTTVASLINTINLRHRRRIITIEDPIEFIFSNENSVIIQREVGRDTADFNVALRQALRQDPDVIMMGEMRDYETIQSVLTAAETGHLILSTMHTNDTCQAIDRIIDVCPKERQGQIRSQLALSLIGVVAQRLLKTATGDLTLAAEILGNNSAVANLIRDGKNHQLFSTMEINYHEGMVTMNRALEALAKTGMVSREEVKQYFSIHQSLIDSKTVDKKNKRG